MSYAVSHHTESHQELNISSIYQMFLWSRRRQNMKTAMHSTDTDCMCRAVNTVLYCQWLYRVVIGSTVLSVDMRVVIGCTVLSVDVPCYRWMYSAVSGCSLLSLEVQCCQRMYRVVIRCTVVSIDVPCCHWMYSTVNGCTCCQCMYSTVNGWTVSSLDV